MGTKLAQKKKSETENWNKNFLIGTKKKKKKKTG